MNQSVIDPEFVARIEAVAEEFGVSIDSKSWLSAGETNQFKRRSLTDFLREADELANRMAVQTIDSTDLIREDRDQL